MEDSKKESNVSILPEQRHYISLEFRCENTSPSQRKLCLEFWEMIDQQPELGQIMATGWSGKEYKPIKTLKVAKSIPQSPCDNLQEIVGHWVEFPHHLRQGRTPDTSCDGKAGGEESPRQLFADLDRFDAAIQPLISIPPRLNTRRDCDFIQ